MTPAEHYTEAERLAAAASNMTDDPMGRAVMLAAAQVHATLATVAGPDPGMPDCRCGHPHDRHERLGYEIQCLADAGHCGCREYTPWPEDLGLCTPKDPTP